VATSTGSMSQLFRGWREWEYRNHVRIKIRNGRRMLGVVI
jgi:hypothetical protein